MANWKKKYNAQEAEKRKEALRQQVEEIINNFENSPENIVDYLKFNSKFHQYSAKNTILIYEQNKFAQFCASYKSFQDIGYQVQKGQTGMKIFVPRITTVFRDPTTDQWIKLSEGTKEQKAQVKSGQLESKQYTSFGIGTVFDIGQTNCPPEDYPKLLDMGYASESHNRLYQALVNYAESQNISLSEKFLPTITARGYYLRSDHSIILSDKLNDSMKLSVMAHELSHAIMHSDDAAADLPQMQKEIEADSLSLMIRQHLGITDIEDVRQSHLQSAYKKYIEMVNENNGDNEYPDLSEILDNVNRAYNGMIDDFDRSINNYLEQHQINDQKLTLEEYLGLQGLASPYSDYMVDKLKIPRGLTERQQKKHDKQLLEVNEEYHARRDAAVKEYNKKVASGEIIPPTNVERYIKAAAGHPDNKSTQAAIRVLEKRGYIRDNNGNWIKNTETSQQKDFSQTIDDFVSGKINPYYQIFVCETTEVMKACGVKDLNVVINQSSIKKILSDDKEKFPHAHNLSIQELKELPKQLQKPIMALKGSHENSVVFVTDIKDVNNNEILISVDVDTAGYKQNVNRVTSMYGKDNITNYLRIQLDNGNLIGCDKKRANQMLSTKGLQLPPATTFIDYTDIISDSDKNVNTEILPDLQISVDSSQIFTNKREFDRDEFEEFTENKNNQYDFIRSTFYNVHFTNEHTIGRMSDCKFHNCIFEHFNGKNIESNNSKYYDCTFNSCDLSEGHFLSTGFYHCTFYDTDLKKSNIELSSIRHTSFNRSDISSVRFYGTSFESVIVHNCIVNERVQGLNRESITMGGATPQEVEIHRSRLFDALKIEPFNEAHPSQQDIDFVAKYENINHIPDAERVTDQSDNFNINILRPNITEQLFTRQLSLADEQAQSLHQHQLQQLKIIHEHNPAPNDYQTWIRNINDIKTFDETLKDSDFIGWEDEGFDESYSAADARIALEAGKITVYSSHPIGQGVFVSPSYMEAKNYSGNGKVYSKEVALTDIAWIDPTQGQYAAVDEDERALTKQLENTEDLPVDVLCDNGKIQWCSFANGINNTEKVKDTLQKIQAKEKQVVSILSNDNIHQLVYINDELQLVPYSDHVFPSADAALRSILENDKIAKLVPYETMLQASVEQDLTVLSECTNQKYPFVKINWSDNAELAQEGCLPLDKAEKLFTDINAGHDESLRQRTNLSLFLDGINTYNLDVDLGAEPGGITDHLNQLINDSDISSDKSMQHLQEYLKEKGLLVNQELQSEQSKQMILFDFAEIT